MKQPIKKNIKNKLTKKNNSSELDGSKLEAFFREKVLDKLGVVYIQQFEIKSIGRFYDFYLPEHNLLIECDGDY